MFIAINSTPCKPSSIIRLTALVPQPPTPTTLMLAKVSTCGVGFMLYGLLICGDLGCVCSFTGLGNFSFIFPSNIRSEVGASKLMMLSSDCSTGLFFSISISISISISLSPFFLRS